LKESPTCHIKRNVNGQTTDLLNSTFTDIDGFNVTEKESHSYDSHRFSNQVVGIKRNRVDEYVSVNDKLNSYINGVEGLLNNEDVTQFSLDELLFIQKRLIDTVSLVNNRLGSCIRKK
jgi:thymidine kinase